MGGGNTNRSPTPPVMFPAQSSFQSAAELLALVVGRVRAIALDAGGGPAFAAVAVFDLADLGQALQDLAVSGDRLALIVVEGEQFTNERQGRNLVTRHTLQFSILAVDANLGSRQAALFGGALAAGVETPGAAPAPMSLGALGLRDLLLGVRPAAALPASARARGGAGCLPPDPASPPPGQPWLIGRLAAQAFLRPRRGEPLVLRDRQRQALAGRAAWLASFDAVGGQLVVDLGQSPVV